MPANGRRPPGLQSCDLLWGTAGVPRQTAVADRHGIGAKRPATSPEPGITTDIGGLPIVGRQSQTAAGDDAMVDGNDRAGFGDHVWSTP